MYDSPIELEWLYSRLGAKNKSTIIEVNRISLVHLNGIYCHMCNSVTYPILRHMLGYTYDKHGGHSHTTWGVVAIALQALSLVEKAKPLQIHFGLHSSDQRSKWMQVGCKIYLDSYVASIGSLMFHGQSNYF